jgi:predicted nucleic-acid-binding protein
MTGLDTNILVRHYTQDDLVQSPKATQFLSTQCSDADPGWISVPVQCELAWVLRKAYKYSRQDLVKVLSTMRQTRGLALEDEPSFDEALSSYATSAADFADCVLFARHRSAGVTDTYTFDERAAKLDGFHLLS